MRRIDEPEHGCARAVEAHGAAADKAAPPAKPLLAGKYDPEKTRVWGAATLRRLQRGPEPAASRNRFASVALHWAQGLLAGLSADTHGSALFRGEAAVLGRCLVTLGTFCRCARLTEAAAPLCGVVLQLLLVRICHSCCICLAFALLRANMRPSRAC